MIKILIIDKTAGLESSHERHQAMAVQPGIDLHVLGPSYWIENGRDIFWHPVNDMAYTAHVGKVWGKDYYARVCYYSGLCHALRTAQPDLIQLLEEPWSICAGQTLLAASFFTPKAGIVFYTWENIFRPWSYPSRASHLYRLIDRSLHKKSIAAVCATQQAKEVLKRKGFSKPIRVIPYGIANCFIEKKNSATGSKCSFTVGYIGRFLQMKGIDLLLEMLKELTEFKLLLVGAGEDEQRYRDEALKAGIAHRIEWHPTVRESQVPDLLRRMDVLVLPSRTTSGWREQLGRVAIEAMAVGIPVVGSSSGAIPEIIGEAGMIFKEGSASDLIQTLMELRHNPAKRKRLAKAGQQRVSKYFTWANFAKNICSFYNELLSTQG